MEWCAKNGIDFVFGLPGNAALDRLVDEAADDIRTRRALVIETVSRVRLAFAAACPDAALIRHIAAALMPAGP